MAQLDFDALLNDIQTRVQQLSNDSKRMSWKYQRLKKDVDKLRRAYDKARLRNGADGLDRPMK
jgi:hypothetical protein